MIEVLKKYKLTRILLDIYEQKKAVWLYLFFGGVTTVLNIVVYEIFTKLLHIDYMISNIIAWIVAVAVAYITNKLYVFESKGLSKAKLINEITSFVLARVGTLGIDILVMYIGFGILGFNDTIMKILANIIVIVSNYFLSKYIIFRK